MDMSMAQDSTGAGVAAEDATAEDTALANRLMAAQMEGLRTENRRLALDLDDLREENRRLRSAAEQMRAEIMVLSRALEPMHRLDEEIARWRGQMLALREEMVNQGARYASNASDRTAEEDRLRESEQHHRARAEELAHFVQAIHASSSWRMTRPWRVLGRRLRGRPGADWPVL